MAYNNNYKQDNAWNLNEKFSESLQKIIDEINMAGLRGQVGQRLNSLEILFDNVYGHQKMKKEKLEELLQKIKKISKRLKNLPYNYDMISLNETQKRYLDSVKNLLNELHRELIAEIYAAGLIFPSNSKDPRYSGLEIK